MSQTLNLASAAESNLLICAVWIIIMIECGISIFTMVGHIGKKQPREHSDRGTMWLIIIGWYFTVSMDFYFRSRTIPPFMQYWLLPYFCFYAGLILTAAGIVLRCSSVFTLKRAFTLSVQTAGDQHLIQTGLYSIVRNPAYTGSLISLLGLALAFRHVLGIPVLALPILCYVIRIRVEEKALKAHFQDEFTAYCYQTKYRLFPGIY